MPLTLAFPTPVGFHDGLDTEICRRCAKAVEAIVADPNENNISHGRLGACTPDDLHTREEFKDLVKLIEPYATGFIDEVLGIDPNDLEMSCMWSNTHFSGSMHPPHVHPNSFLSGVIYVQNPPAKEAGNIYFSSPSPGREAWFPDFKQQSVISDEVLWFTPTVGKLILFPSWLPHGVYEYISDSPEPRISIAFNYILKRASRNTATLRYSK